MFIGKSHYISILIYVIYLFSYRNVVLGNNNLGVTNNSGLGFLYEHPFLYWAN